MFKYTEQVNSQENILYNIILSLSRQKLFYTKFKLIDTFQNRIHLIFIHISFIFIKMKNDSRGEVSKTFYQKIFDLIFNKIEVNMREIGFSDTTINKNMRFLVKTFYNIENMKKLSFAEEITENEIRKENFVYSFLSSVRQKMQQKKKTSQ